MTNVPDWKAARGHTEIGLLVLQVYLAVHSVQLVVEGHGEVGGGAGGHVGDKGRLALVDRVVHVDAALADLHVLEARLDAVQTGRRRERERDGEMEGD